MEEQLQDFLDYLQQEYKYSNNTTAAYKNDLSQFMTFLENGRFHVEQWSDVTAPIVNAYVAFMKDQAYASSSVARKVAAVKSFFNYLFARNLITENPTTNIDSPKVKKRLPKTLSFEDIEKLLLAPRQKKIAQTPARHSASHHALQHRDARDRSSVAGRRRCKFRR